MLTWTVYARIGSEAESRATPADPHKERGTSQLEGVRRPIRIPPLGDVAPRPVVS